MTVQGLTCQQAGKLGGEATRDRIGSSGYRRLAAIKNGRAGNAAQRASLGEAGMRRKAVAGGAALLARRGRSYYADLGKRSHPR